MSKWKSGLGWSSMVAGMQPLKSWSTNLQARGDSNGAIVENALEVTIDRVYERAVPRHPLLDLVSFNTSLDPAATATRYNEGESRAAWSPMGPRSADFGTSDIKEQSVTIPTQYYYSGYDVWLQEARALASSSDNTAIPRKAGACISGYRDLLVLHFLCGDADAKIPGLLNNDKIKNTRRYSASKRITPATTADDMAKLLIELCHSIADESEDIYGDESGYALALPSKLYRLAKRTHFSTSKDDTVLSRVISDTDFQVIPVNRLNGIDGGLLGSGTGNVSVAFAAKLSEQTHQKQLPNPMEQLGAFVDNAGLRSVVPMIANIGGLHIYEPNAFATALNIYSDS